MRISHAVLASLPCRTALHLAARACNSSTLRIILESVAPGMVRVWHQALNRVFCFVLEIQLHDSTVHGAGLAPGKV